MNTEEKYLSFIENILSSGKEKNHQQTKQPFPHKKNSSIHPLL